MRSISFPRLDRSDLFAILLGAVDTSVTAGYIFGVDPIMWHVGTLIAKFCLLMFTLGRWQPVRFPATLFLVGFSGLVAISSLNQNGTVIAYVQAGGFLAHLLMTSLLMKAEKLKAYIHGAVAVITAVAVVHGLLCFTGRITSEWGRFYYFGRNQPNLGGEIAAGAAVAAAYAMRRPLAVAVIVVLLADTLLLQARSSSMSCILAIVVLVAFDREQRLSSRKTAFLAAVAVVATILVFQTPQGDRIIQSVSDIFALNSEYRGLESGISGRGELWAFAWRCFNDSPIFGYALGYYDAIGYLGAHNLFLSALSQFGIMALVLFAILGYLTWEVSKSGLYAFACLLCALPLFMFNDRLINLNPYPYLIYVMMITIAGEVSPRRVVAAPGLAPVRSLPPTARPRQI